MAKRGPGKPFEPGQSGNPAGRPKASITFQALCREERPALFEKLKAIAYEHGHTHQIRAIELMLAYDLGRPTQTHNVRTIRSFADLTDEEIAALVSAGDADAARIRH
jgi:hypothetical protein